MPLIVTFVGTGGGDTSRPSLEEAANTAATDFLSGTAAGLEFVAAKIRGAAHDTTGAGPNRRPDDLHATINFKTDAMVDSGNHIPAHVYLDQLQQNPNVYAVTRVTWFKLHND